METEVCFSCKGTFPKSSGPVHAYMDSSAGCWSSFGKVLAKEYENPAYFATHRLTVDAYAVQHPSGHSRQAIQSVGVHLVRLCLFLEHGLSPESANDAMLSAAKLKHDYVWLSPPHSLGRITVADVCAAATVSSHIALVRAWAEQMWAVWGDHRETVRKWASQT